MSKWVKRDALQHWFIADNMSSTHQERKKYSFVFKVVCAGSSGGSLFFFVLRTPLVGMMWPCVENFVPKRLFIDEHLQLCERFKIWLWERKSGLSLFSRSGHRSSRWFSAVGNAMHRPSIILCLLSVRGCTLCPDKTENIHKVPATSQQPWQNAVCVCFSPKTYLQMRQLRGVLLFTSSLRAPATFTVQRRQ